MKLMCWNINGLLPTIRNAVLSQGSWKGFFEAHRLDALLLQEAKLPEEKLTLEAVCVEGFQSFWAFSVKRKGYSGVVSYISSEYSPLACELDDLPAADTEGVNGEGRTIVTDLGCFTLINVYVPNAGDKNAGRPRLAHKLAFLEALRRKADALAAAGREVLIVGDLNVAASPADVHPSIGYEGLYAEEERTALSALLERYTDVWRALHPEATGVYSVWDEKTSARAFNQGLRIDYVLATPGLLSRVASCELLPASVIPPKWSDHAAIVLELKDAPPPAPHPPCAEWARLLKRWKDPAQRSILSMFGKRPAAGSGSGSAGEAGGAAQPKRARPAEPLPAEAAGEAGAVDAAAPAPPQESRDGSGAAAAEGSTAAVAEAAVQAAPTAEAAAAQPQPRPPKKGSIAAFFTKPGGAPQLK